MKVVKIKDLGRTVTGHTPPTSESKYYGDYMPFVKPTDIDKESKYTYNPEQYYSQEAAEKYRTSLIPKGSTCVVCIGTIGEKMTMAHCDLFTNQSINSIIPSKDYDPDYVYYLLKYNLGKVKALNKGTASGREFVSKSSFLEMDVNIHDDKKTRERIGAILSSYDLLIENTRKQICLLEEAASSIYKEWFINLRFPGCENILIEDGIPSGWKKTTLGVITSKFATGLNPRKNFVLGQGHNYYVTIKNMAHNSVIFDDKCDMVNDEALIKINNRSHLSKGDLLFSGIGTIGRVYLIDKDPVNWNISESIFTLRPKEGVSPYYLYLLLLDDDIQNYSQANSHGCAQKGIRMADLKAFPVLLPPEEVMKEFIKIVAPIIERAKRLDWQTKRLIEARDILIPRLMSEDVTV